ncbi:LuxR C-terminal-related transcriptional regulator [Amycolatopsis kentuckyensis]|uniref:LuxR C-terminal-related transcriptional regulator n=1 Tax=Amycolatopsis kentuckyensis TaxID=218823 RepID=UPI00356822F5
MTAGDEDRVVDDRDAPMPSVAVPVELDSFVGRGGLLDRVRELLSRSDTRLVTLTGFGGVGKTRLLHRLAHDQTSTRSYRDGVVVVSLVELREGGDRLYGAIADALAIHDSASQPGLDRLCDYLRDRQMLLMLDNCEHLVGAPGTGPVPTLLNTLLRRAPGLQVMATSRERLGVRGERLVPVPPLCVGDEERCDCDAGTEGVHEALQLLLDRAAELHVTIGENDHPVAAQLCRRLDGIPLAIELAAATLQGNAMTVRALTKHPDLLSLLNHGTSGQHSHRSLEAMVRWSYALLGEPEQKLWAAASIFEGGFDLDAIHELVHPIGLDDTKVETLLVTLVGKNILKAVARRDSRPRYRMLETIRQYGRLVSEPDHAQLHQAHTSYFEALATQASREWIGPQQIEWMVRLNEFRPDLIAAQLRLLSTPQTAERGLDLAIQVSRTCAFIFSGRLNENVRMLTAGLDRHRGSPSVNQVAGLSLAAWIALIQGNHARADPLLHHAEAAAAGLDLAGAFGPLDTARATRLWLVEQDPARARESLTLFRRAARAYAAVGAVADEWMARLLLTMSAASLHCLDVAKADSESLLADAEAAHAPWSISWALWSRALVELLEGDPRQAARSVQQALRIQREIGDAWGPAWSLWLIALIAARLDDYATAAKVLGGARARQQSAQASVLGLTPFLRLQRLAETAGRQALGKDPLGNDLWDCHVAAGRDLSPQDMDALALAPLAAPGTGGPPDGVTAREFEVAGLLAQGLSNEAIGAQLEMSRRTVSTHVSNLNKKLGTTSRIEIAAWHLRTGAEPATGSDRDEP